MNQPSVFYVKVLSTGRGGKADDIPACVKFVLPPAGR